MNKAQFFEAAMVVVKMAQAQNWTAIGKLSLLKSLKGTEVKIVVQSEKNWIALVLVVTYFEMISAEI